MRILFATGPIHGLTLPVIPLIWAARTAGHEVLLATTSRMPDVAAHAGVPVVDVVPGRDIWADLLQSARAEARTETARPGESSGHVHALEASNPFRTFTLTMTSGTVEAGRSFGAELVVSTSDHAAGLLAAAALGVPAVELGNRISWSMRDRSFREKQTVFREDDAILALRAELGTLDRGPNVIARVDPRAPSMGGISSDESDERDGVPWWPMRFVPFNGGATVPDWAWHTPQRPRVCVSFGTVVPATGGATNLGVVVEAMRGLNMEAVVTVDETTLAEVGDVPDNVRAVGYLPLTAVLSTCSLSVHHGGSGTAAAPLHHGVPQLVLPVQIDNRLVAERITERGVGLALDPVTARVDTVRSAIRRLLDEPAFATTATEVAAEMATQSAPAAIVDRIAAAVARC